MYENFVICFPMLPYCIRIYLSLKEIPRPYRSPQLPRDRTDPIREVLMAIIILRLININIQTFTHGDNDRDFQTAKTY